MPKPDVLTSWKADTRQHDAALAKSKAKLEEMAQVQNVLNTTTKAVSNVFSKFSAVLGVGLGAVEAFTKTINASETTADEYGRVMQSITTASDNFFYALNTGNLDNFFTNLDRSIQAARELYDALDDVGSIKMNNRAAIAIQERALQELRVRKQQGQNVDAEMRSVEERIKYLKNQEVTAQRKAAVKSVAATLSDVADEELAKKISTQLFVRGQDYFREMTAKYKELQEKGMGDVVITQGSSVSGASSSVVARAFDKSNLSATDQRIYDVVEAIVKKEAKLSEAIGMWADAENAAGAISQQEFRVNRWAGSATGGGGAAKSTKKGGEKTDTVKALTKNQLWELTREQYEDNLDEMANSSYVDAFIATQKRLADANFFNGLNGDNIEFNQYISNLEQIQKEADKTREKYAKTTDEIGMFGSALSAVGSNLGIPALNIAGTLAQAIANMMMGYAQATAEGAKLGPIGWAAMALSGLATVTSIVNQMKNLSTFAEGGIAYGTTLGIFGEYAGAAHNPEVVAPLDKLRNIIGDTGGAVEFHIQGRELVGILNKQTRINSRNV